MSLIINNLSWSGCNNRWVLANRKEEPAKKEQPLFSFCRQSVSPLPKSQHCICLFVRLFHCNGYSPSIELDRSGAWRSHLETLKHSLLIYCRNIFFLHLIYLTQFDILLFNSERLCYSHKNGNTGAGIVFTYHWDVKGETAQTSASPSARLPTYRPISVTFPENMLWYIVNLPRLFMMRSSQNTLAIHCLRRVSNSRAFVFH